ncbi:hypothetical protein GCM10025768_00470 [Microbacterium pseudoresistens]
MPANESRPYRVPAQRSVTVRVRCVNPEVELNELPDEWEPGQDLVIRVSAELAPEFWDECGIPVDESVVLVGDVTCLVAREKWRGESPFAHDGQTWSAEVEIKVDGDAVAVEALLDVAVVGPGRTGHPDPARGVHHAARLWSLPATIKIPFERLGEAFPTSAVSFAETGRRRVPWQVDVAHDAEPAWGLSSAMRLYVNIDLAAAETILDGSAPRWIYQAIQADIYSAALFQLAAVRDGYSPTFVAECAETDVTSFAAFCSHVASVLGFDLELALRIASEDAMNLIDRAREASSFMTEVA